MRAHEEKVTGIALGLKDAGAGFIEIVSDLRDARAEMAMLRRVASSSGRLVLYSLIQRHDPAHSGVWRDLMEEADAAVRDGHSIRGVFPPRIIVSLFLAGPQQRTLPLQMLSGVKEEISPAITAAAKLLAVVELLRQRSERLADQAE